ncbi:MAG: transposase [Planctomycetota bacterium]
MPSFRRAFVPGGTYFFTIVTYQRQPLFQHTRAVSLLGETIRQCIRQWPLAVKAIVLLPDHWHTIWSLPSGDSDYSKRIGWLKKEFTKRWITAGGQEKSTTASQRDQRRRGIWQPRFWEHTIEDEHDFERHFDYIHWNPVKHGYSHCPSDWPWSSFHGWVERGVYSNRWGCSERKKIAPYGIDKIKDAGEP